MISRDEAMKFMRTSLITTNDEELICEVLINKIYDSIVPEDTDKNDPWRWVKTEYVPLFKAKNPDKGKYAREATARLKAMFSARPEIRKEDVLLTVKLYLSQTDSRYIRFPHYFLKKGQGANAIYEFDSWYEQYLEAKKTETGRTSKTNTMQ